MGAGHYGIFSGRRWREKVYPTVRDFIAKHQHAMAGGVKTARKTAAKPTTKPATKLAAKKVAKTAARQRA
jgi:poly(3-hydroxybutyrate) depolymerase